METYSVCDELWNECAQSADNKLEEVMKLLFLDIDGVLNNESTRTVGPTGFKGLEPRLVQKFLDWHGKQDKLNVCLSSTWRTDPLTLKHVQDAGIPLIGVTMNSHFTHPKTRGFEVDHFVTIYKPKKYAILDDCHEFYGHQIPCFVQTSYRHGLRDRDLAKLDRILN